MRFYFRLYLVGNHKELEDSVYEAGFDDCLFVSHQDRPIIQGTRNEDSLLSLLTSLIEACKNHNLHIEEIQAWKGEK